MLLLAASKCPTTKCKFPHVPTLIETAKANCQEPYAWLRHILERLPTAQSVEDYEALLPWNCSPASAFAS